MQEKNYLLSKEVAERKMKRMALEIAEQLSGEENELVLIGIKESGWVVAEKMYSLICPLLQMEVRLISCLVDKKLPEDIGYSEYINFDGLNVIVIDDVINSGRTLLYALKPLLNFHPRLIKTLCLVERMHKVFPVKPDYVGLSVATTLQDHIIVEVDNGEVMGAYLS